MKFIGHFLAGICAAQAVVAASSGDATESHKDGRPNIVFVITDDQDLHLDSLNYLPKIKKHIADQGTTYSRHYCTIAICCPSRVSLLTGKAAHNTNVTDVVPPYGGYPKFISQGLNSNYLPVWLQEAGYTTHYVGKLMNSQSTTTYDQPFAAGWDQNDFLVDPYTYQYYSPAFQHNHDAPVVHKGEYSTDLVNQKASAFLDAAVAAKKPFFLGVAPVAPHAQVDLTTRQFTEPEPAQKYAGLFNDSIVPRSANFNPDAPSGASWVRQLKKQNQTVVEYNDHFYRQRLRALQSVDELVEDLVHRLEKHGVLDNTYIIYTSDNGYHIGQHRLLPGKTCGYEEDINVPFIMRGPGVPKGHTTDLVSSHTDLAPTFLRIAGAKPRPDFDGSAIPYLQADLMRSKHVPSQEHVNVEFWGVGGGEGIYGNEILPNNTYKAVRIYASEYNLYYSVWCTNEHELYDLSRDPGQLNNLLLAPKPHKEFLGRPLEQVRRRLDALLLVLKSCKGDACRQPWHALQPRARISSLREALQPRYDDFFAEQSRKASVSFSACMLGQLLQFEGPQFSGPAGLEPLLTRADGTRWDDWV